MRLVQLADEIIIAAEFLEVADSGAACTQSVSFFFLPPGGQCFSISNIEGHDHGAAFFKKLNI